MAGRRTLRFAAYLALWVAFLPLGAHANAGTPLMWAGMLHLVFGNALIGLVEGLLIALVFKRPKLLCIALLIAANYFSAWLGGVGIANGVAHALTWDLYNAWRQFWLLVVLTFGVSLLLEWPFVAACFWKQPQWARRSLAALLLTQTLSYVLLFGWYWGASGKSLYTRMHIVAPAEITTPGSVRLFYIRAQDGQICEWSSTSGVSKPRGNLKSTGANDRLLYWPPVDGAAECLCLRREGMNGEEAVFETITDSTGGLIRNPGQTDQEDGRETSFNFGDALPVGDAVSSPWHFLTGFWAVEGMTAEKGEEKPFHFAWETPFSSWYIRNAIHLPGDKVIFQLGDDQICLLDPETRQIALLLKGRGPAVAPPTEE